MKILISCAYTVYNAFNILCIRNVLNNHRKKTSLNEAKTFLPKLAIFQNNIYLNLFNIGFDFHPDSSFKLFQIFQIGSFMQ